MMHPPIEFTYKCKGKITIRDFLVHKGYSENNIYYLLAEKQVFVNGKIVTSKNFYITEKASIHVVLLNETSTIIPKKHPLKILFEDEYFLIVDKPANLDVEPTIACPEDNLASYVLAYFQEHQIHSTIHLVNRLDKLTSGIVLLAKNQYIHNCMNNAKIIKKYEALCEGNQIKNGYIKIKIKKDENSVKRIVSEEGLMCLTKYKKIKDVGENSLISLTLLTGRTHQIRVSMASINHPLVNDPLYGKKSVDMPMYLRACYLQFTHPFTHRKLKIKLS